MIEDKPQDYRAMREERPEGTMNATVAGAVGALAGGLAWYLAVRTSGYEVGWIAWGIGFLVGAAMAWATPRRSKSLAVRAGVMATLGLVVGKLLILQWMAGPALTQELQGDQESLRQVAFFDLYESGQLSQDLQIQLMNQAEDEPWSEALSAKVDQEIDARLASMSPEELEAAASRMAGLITAGIGVGEGLWMSFTLFDALWLFLAIGTAWKMLLPVAAPEPEPQPEPEPEPEVAVG